MVKSDKQADLKRGLSMEPQGNHSKLQSSWLLRMLQTSILIHVYPCCLGRWNTLDFQHLQPIEVQLTNVPKKISASAQIRSETPWNWHRTRVAWPASKETSWTLKTDRKGRSTSWVTKQGKKLHQWRFNEWGYNTYGHISYIIYSYKHMYITYLSWGYIVWINEWG